MAVALGVIAAGGLTVGVSMLLWTLADTAWVQGWEPSLYLAAAWLLFGMTSWAGPRVLRRRRTKPVAGGCVRVGGAAPDRGESDLLGLIHGWHHPMVGGPNVVVEVDLAGAEDVGMAARGREGAAQTTGRGAGRADEDVARAG